MMACGKPRMPSPQPLCLQSICPELTFAQAPATAPCFSVSGHSPSSGLPELRLLHRAMPFPCSEPALAPHHLLEPTTLPALG